MIIRQARDPDFMHIWPMYKEVARAGETYAFETDITKQEAKKVWLDTPQKTFIAEENGIALATYYIKPNHAGPGKHVCNCGYIVSSAARGRGLASAMCEHSQTVAKQLGYKAMQFNFVASSNEGAVRLWLKLGFDIVGHLPKGFNHPKKGFVDALIMYKCLDPQL